MPKHVARVEKGPAASATALRHAQCCLHEIRGVSSDLLSASQASALGRIQQHGAVLLSFADGHLPGTNHGLGLRGMECRVRLFCLGER
jgi:hypothetical protein